MLDYILEKRTRPETATIREHFRNVSVIESNTDTMYFIDQREIIKAYHTKWSGREKGHTANDEYRMFECMIMERNLERTACFLKNFVKDVEELENTAYSVPHYMGTLAANFCDITNVFLPPQNKSKVVGHELMDPNNPSRINIACTGKWVLKVGTLLIKGYRSLAHEYQMGTGGGSGPPENYYDWNKRDDKYLNGYTPNGHLGLVYMKDPELRYLFTAKTRLIDPNEAVCTTNLDWFFHKSLCK